MRLCHPSLSLLFNCFRQGLSDVINLDWLRMFSCRELQTLISGAEHNIDITDLQNNTKYGNGYSEDHQTIKMFWNVIRNSEENDKRAMLKFVTSCSRPPLLGFKVNNILVCFSFITLKLFEIPFKNINYVCVPNVTAVR